jgi:16S rRNA (uracil1498-N3)-methyltransferase
VRFLTTLLAYHVSTISEPSPQLEKIPVAQLQRLAITPSQCINETTFVLKSEQLHYLTRVLRLTAGDRFIAIPGTGTWWLAELHANAEAKILQTLTPDTELVGKLTLLAAPSKGNGFDDVVRITTELGVSQIVPLITQRTVLQPSPHRITRWQRIAQEAAEQSHRLIVPDIAPPLAMADALQYSQQAVAHGQSCYIGTVDPRQPHLLQHPIASEHQGVVILVGPEGGWTEAEQENAIAAGCKPFSLGRRVLRAITAAIVVIALFSAQYELEDRSAKQ